jgi:hypothetical protein
MIAIVAICKDEVDIVERWLDHHFAEGVDWAYIADASTDGTREILEAHNRVTVLPDTDQYVQQAAWTNRLAVMAGDEGADWILPTDLDEFVYAPSGATVAEALADCPHGVLALTCWPHLDWDTRYEAPHRLPKVCYRYRPDAWVAVGNHSVTGPPGVYDVLAMRELQYRGYDHFVRKVRERSAVLSPQDRAVGVGSHCTRLDGWSDDQMRVEWESHIAAPTVYDPIPSHVL